MVKEGDRKREPIASTLPRKIFPTTSECISMASRARNSSYKWLTSLPRQSIVRKQRVRPCRGWPYFILTVSLLCLLFMCINVYMYIIDISQENAQRVTTALGSESSSSLSPKNGNNNHLAVFFNTYIPHEGNQRLALKIIRKQLLALNAQILLRNAIVYYTRLATLPSHFLTVETSHV